MRENWERITCLVGLAVLIAVLLFGPSPFKDRVERLNALTPSKAAASGQNPAAAPIRQRSQELPPHPEPGDASAKDCPNPSSPDLLSIKDLIAAADCQHLNENDRIAESLYSAALRRAVETHNEQEQVEVLLHAGRTWTEHRRSPPSLDNARGLLLRATQAAQRAKLPRMEALCYQELGKLALDRGFRQEAQGDFVSQLSAATSAKDVTLQIDAEMSLGKISTLRNDRPQTRAHFDRARTLASATADDKFLSRLDREISRNLDPLRLDAEKSLDPAEEEKREREQKGLCTPAPPSAGHLCAEDPEYLLASGLVPILDKGRLLARENKHKEAIDVWQTALPTALSSGDPRLVGVFSFQIGKAYRNLGDIPRALYHWERGAAAAERAGDIAGASFTLAMIAGIHRAQGRLDRALEFFQRSIDLDTKIGALNNKCLSLSNMAALRAERGEFAKALEDGNNALSLIEHLRNPADAAMIHLNLGHIHLQLGNNAEATEHTKTALTITESYGDIAGIARALDHLSVMSLRAEDYPEALRLVTQAMDIAQRLSSQSLLINILLNRADALAAIGDPKGALTDKLRALRLSQEQCRANPGSTPPDPTGCRTTEARISSGLGNIYSRIGDLEQAETHLNHAISLNETDKDLCKLAENRRLLARVYQNLQLFDQAFAEVRKAKELQRPPSGACLFPEEDILLDMGRLEDARKCFQPKTASAWGGRYHLLRGEPELALAQFDPIVKLEKIGTDEPNITAARIGRGMALEALGRFAEARQEFRTVQSILEETREQLGRSYRGNYLREREIGFRRLEAYEAMVRLAGPLNEGIGAAFRHAEFTRGRSFSEMLSGRHQGVWAGIPAAIRAEEADIAQKIADILKQKRMAFLGRDLSGVQALQGQLAGLRTQQGSLSRRLRKDFPKYAAVNHPEPVDPEDIPLRPDEILIEFEVMEPVTKVFGVRAGKEVFAEDIPISRQALEVLVRKYRRSLGDVQRDADLALLDIPAGQRLYQLLFQPLLAAQDTSGDRRIRPADRFIIVPDEILGILPFESLIADAPARVHLPNQGKGPAPSGLRFLGDDYDLAYAQSATALTIQRRLRTSRSARDSLFALADPIFDDSDPRIDHGLLVRTNLTDPRLARMSAVIQHLGFGGTRPGASAQKNVADAGNIRFPRLRRTGLLAENLRKTAFSSHPAEILSGADATEDRLQATDLSLFRYILFATHGILDDTVPHIREPALVLSQPSPQSNSDGFLTMSEAMELRLNADVVALTACNTGAGKLVTGEGVMGLGRAFQYAGAKNVLVSLWDVAEDSSVLLVERFFTQIRNGKTPREALRLARAELKREGYVHPYYWAPFILYTE